MTDIKAKFDECFKAEFPATYEAALRGEPRPHGDFSNAWWGFREGYRCALPTTEPERSNKRFNDKGWMAMLIIWAAFGALLGYKYPRDLELESTKPIVLKYEVTPEAARILVSRSVQGLPKCEAPEQ